MTRQTRQPARAPVVEPTEEPTAEGAALREAARQMREPARPLKPGEVMGRNGEILTLKRSPDTNVFAIPAHLNSDPGWTREWKRFEILNKYDETHQQHLAENGWRPVMVEPGNGWGEYFGGPNYKGPVRREDMILMERPTLLTEQVRNMEKQRADQQLRMNYDRYNGKKAFDTPQGFTMNNPNLDNRVKTNYEQGPAAAAHQTIPD
jgi:hypothetical protein